jgi:uncharacterized protein (TIRG00374 family)
MKRLIVFLLFLALGLGLFWLVLKVIGWPQIKGYLAGFALWQGGVIFALGFVGLIIDGWRWREILKKRNIRFSLFSLWKILLAGFPIRFFLPMFLVGGDFLQAYLLKKQHYASWADTLASVTVNKILIWTVNLIVMFWGVFYLFFMASGFPRNLLLVLTAGFFVFLLVLIFFYFSTFKRKSFSKSLLSLFPSLQNHNGFRNVSEEMSKIERIVFDFFNLKRFAFWKCLVISFLRVAISFLATWLLIIFLGRQLSFLKTLSLLGLSILTTMVPIPAKLGSHEAVQGAAFNVLGLGAGRGVVFAMFNRAVEIAISLIGIIFLLRLLGRGLFRRLRDLRRLSSKVSAQ